MKISTLRKMSAADQVAYIQRGLGQGLFTKPPKAYLWPKSRLLSKVMGSESMGIAYGKVITIAGEPSSGKSVLAARIMGLAQQDGAQVAWIGIEDRIDPDFSKVQGLDLGDEVLDEDGSAIGYSKVALFEPKFGVFKKTNKEKATEKKAKKKQRGEKQPEPKDEQVAFEERLQTAEELLDGVKRWMLVQRKIHGPDVKLAMALDSTTALQPAEEIEAGLTNATMRSKLSLAPLLNQFCKDIITLASNTNALVVLIAQLRQNPMMMFGDPRYIPGGNGVLFYPAVINWMRRVRNIKYEGKTVGLESIITNKKNKSGAGSVEKEEIGIKIYFASDKWKCVPAEQMKKDAKKRDRP